MPLYSYMALSQAQATLSSRLYDQQQQFWPPAELTLYINEALRTWNALTGYWRNDFIFPSVSDVTWYDLTQVPGTLRPYTVFDTDLYTIIQYHLLESVSWNPWNSSNQFSYKDLIAAVQRRRDEILGTCGPTQTRHTFPAVAGRIILPDSTIDIRRVAYIPAVENPTGYGQGTYGFGPYSAINPVGVPGVTVLWPEDTWAEQSFNRKYTLSAAGLPMSYLISTQPQLSFDTDAPPAWGGIYEVLTVDAGVPLVAQTPNNLNVPDDWTHVIKWGALADLFSRESNAKDPLRAQYCEQRYRMGLKLLTAAPALLAMRLDNSPLQVDSVRAADLYNTLWQGAATTRPSQAYYSGMNLVALAPTPFRNHSVMATVVENAPLPVLQSDYLQIGRDQIDVIIDYAQHLAALKMGGQEFIETIPLFQRFMQQVELYGTKLNEVAEYTSAIYGLSNLEENANPRVTVTP